MEKFISGQKIIREVIIPPSKSYAQRAILAATLSKNTTTLQNIGTSDDVLAMINVAKKLGATIHSEQDDLIIRGFTQPVERHLSVGESGLGMRLVTAISAVLDGDFTISAEGSLKNRPMDEFSKILPQIGVVYEQDKKKTVIFSFLETLIPQKLKWMEV